MTVAETAALTGALTVAIGAIELAKAIVAKRNNGDQTRKDEACEDCQATVGMLAKNAERTDRTLGEIRDGVRDLVRIAERR